MFSEADCPKMSSSPLDDIKKAMREFSERKIAFREKHPHWDHDRIAVVGESMMFICTIEEFLLAREKDEPYSVFDSTSGD